MGKRTTTRHKEDNTFKFETFEEKLKNISVTVNLSIRDGRTDLPNDESTFFFQEIEKWTDLNRTESFGELLEEIGQDVQTLHQLLHQKDRLAKVFLEHLQNPENKSSFEPAFALLVSMSRDLGAEFYPFLPSFFKAIIDIAISSRDTEIIEKGFKAYAYLAKYLRREIIRDLSQHLKQFAPLLDSKHKKYVVIFGCEAFEVVVSKYAKDHPLNFLELLYKILLRKSPQNAFGVGTLLFAMLKGVRGSLKIGGPGLKLHDTVNYISSLKEGGDRESWVEVLKTLITKLLNHGNPSDTDAVFKVIENWLVSSQSSYPDHSSLLLPLYKSMLELDGGSKITDVNAAVSTLRTLTPLMTKLCSNDLAELIITLIETKGKSSNPELFSSLKPSIFTLLETADLSIVSKIDRTLQDSSHYFQSYMISIVQAYERLDPAHTAMKNAETLRSKLIFCISNGVIRQNGFYHMLKKQETFFTGLATPMCYYGNQTRLIRPLNMTGLNKEFFDCCSLLGQTEAALLEDTFDPEHLSRFLLSHSRMALNPCKSCPEGYLKIARSLISLQEEGHKEKEEVSRLLFLTLECLMMLGPCLDPSSSSKSFILQQTDILNYLTSVQESIYGASDSTSRFSLWTLKTVDLVVHLAKITQEKDAEARKVGPFLKERVDKLSCNLLSGFKVVRSLTLSILRNIYFEKSNIGTEESKKDEKLVEMLDKFLTIENMSILDPKFSPVVKSALTECKVLMESPSATQLTKMICFKYSLGLLSSNFNLIWPSCIDVVHLAGHNIPFDKFWTVFGPHFQMHFPSSSSSSTPRLVVLQVKDQDEGEANFLYKLETKAFGFPEEVSNKLGPQEHFDVAQYKVNLWKCLVGLPLRKADYAEIKPIVDKTITRSFDNSSERGNFAETNKMLVPMFEFLQKVDHAGADLSLWERSLDHLISTTDVQKAVWEFLHAKRKNKLKNYKVDIDELIGSDSMDCVHKFRIDAIDTSQNKQYENETLEKRHIFMDIIIRILIGKEKRWKSEKRLQVLRFIGGCTEADARKYLELTVGTALQEERISPKAIEVKVNKITNAVRTWRYKFPTILDDLLNSVCKLAASLPNLQKPLPKHQEEEELPEQVFEEQKKGALKAARLSLISFFTFLPKFNIEEKTVHRIFDVFIWTGIDEMKLQSGANVSWIMKLFLVWSSHERFHPLFSIVKEAGDPLQSPIGGIFDLLKPKSQFEVIKYLLGILLNLIEPPQSESDHLESELSVDQDQEELAHSEKIDAKPIVSSRFYPFQTSESPGLNAVLFGKEEILDIFQNVTLFKRIVSQPGGERVLSLISKLGDFVEESESTEKLCTILIEAFSMYKYNEENLHQCLLACKSLLRKVPQPEKLLVKLSSAFIFVTGRRLRTALSDILTSQPDLFLYENMRDLNSWMDSATDTPDFSKRQSAFQKIEKAIREDPFNPLLFTLTACNCFYGLIHETDLGMRNSAKNLLIILSQAVQPLEPHQSEKLPQFRSFLESVILPRLRSGLYQKEENRFADFLQVFIAFIKNGKEAHGTLKELDKVLSPEIIEGLQDLQIHLRTRAMNKLGKRILEVGKELSPAILKNYVLPLANHNLLDEEKMGKNNNELIDSSIEVLKNILSLLPHESYFKYLSNLVDVSKKKTKLAKQYERILVATMDAFHFDLSLGTTEGQNRADADAAAAAKALAQDEIAASADNDKDMTGQEEGRVGEGDFVESELESEEEDVPINSKTTNNTANQGCLTLVPKSGAVKCLKLLKTGIIPKLRKYLNFEEKATHKLSRAEKSVDEDVILKIPCTLALVKLLKKIPKAEGEASIRSIIPLLCAGLRNELVSIRNTLRKTLLNVVRELGLAFFPSVVSYLKSTLQRGYQKHVLNFTVGYLIKCLETELKAAPQYLPIKEILPLCVDELYGVMQEEKDVAKIKAKTREASKSNAHPILRLCAKCVQSKGSLKALIDPAVKHFADKKSPKIAKTTRDWLASVGEGLADNLILNHEDLITWLKEVVDQESLEVSPSKFKEPEVKKRKLLVETKDVFLIASSKKKSVSDGSSGSHFLLTEFGFNCLYNGLNRSNRLKMFLLTNSLVHLLDPFVPKLSVGIMSSSKQVNIVALRCLTLLYEFDLESFKNPEIVDGLRRNGFVAMNNHCYRTTSDTQMTNSTFKFLTGFFLRFSDYKITVQDFELMLKCIQSYLTNGECSSAAITLLKGILKNKFKSANLPELMDEVFKQSIRSHYQHINEGCRQAYFIYLSNYCTTPKELSLQIQMILNQFEYPIESGRNAAVEMITSLITEMPQNSFEEVKELLFLKALSTLEKETQPKVREKLVEITKRLFLKDSGKKTLVRLFIKLLQMDKHITELDTFLLVAGGVISEAQVFSGPELIKLLEKILQVLDPTSFEELVDKVPNISQQAQDYAIYQALVCLKKGISRTVGGANLWSPSSSCSQLMQNIFSSMRETHFLYEHEWVPLVTLDIFTIVFDKMELLKEDSKLALVQLIDIDEAEETLNKPQNIVITSREDLKGFLTKLWKIIRFGSREDVLMKGAVMLVQLASISAHLTDQSIFTDTIAEIKNAVNHEVVKDPKNTTIRSLAFGIFRGVVKSIPEEPVKSIAESITRVAVRELTDEGVPAELKAEAEKLTASLRQVLGNAEFNALYAHVTDYYHQKRNQNRAKKKEQVVLHPGLVRKRPKKPTGPDVGFKLAKVSKAKKSR